MKARSNGSGYGELHGPDHDPNHGPDRDLDDGNAKVALPIRRSKAWREFLLAGGSLAMLFLLGGCSEKFAVAGLGYGDCKVGEEDCACRVDRGCDDGLSCVGDVCRPEQSSTAVEPSTSESPDLSSSSEEPDKGSSSSTSASSTPSATTDSTTSDDKVSSCEDGVLNGNESDKDCGGGQCPTCELGKKCRAGQDCKSGHCQDGVCAINSADCVSDADCTKSLVCKTSSCVNGKCQAQSNRPDGSSCDDKDPCTAIDQCKSGTCRGVNTLLLEEDFKDGGPGWTMEAQDGPSQWEIGRAKASDCGGDDDDDDEGFGEDPAQDHSPGTDNMLAGVVIGGCYDRNARRTRDCLWSPFVNPEFFEQNVVLSFWRHLHSPSASGRKGHRRGVSNSLWYRTRDGREVELTKGFAEAVNDRNWTFVKYELEGESYDFEEISMGICFERRSRRRVPPFAGWSVDDVRIRQAGCKMDR